MWIKNFFNEQWVERVHKIFEKYSDQQGDSLTSKGSVPENYLMKTARSNKETQLAGELKHVARLANESMYGFNIWYDADVIQYTTYNSSNQMGYRPHCDSVWLGKPVVQKLTVVVGLTDQKDYEGGRLVFPGYGSSGVKLTAGQVIAFPSIMVHEVQPVTSGIRQSLVTWYKGPRWL